MNGRCILGVAVILAILSVSAQAAESSKSHECKGANRIEIDQGARKVWSCDAGKKATEIYDGDEVRLPAGRVAVVAVNSNSALNELSVSSEKIDAQELASLQAFFKAFKPYAVDVGMTALKSAFVGSDQKSTDPVKAVSDVHESLIKVRKMLATLDGYILG